MSEPPKRAAPTPAAARGAKAEALAAQFLHAKGLALIERNYRCRMGEVDLVMRDGATLVFVEVRRRASGAYGGAAASITAAKRDRIVAAARHYLAGRTSVPACRFDAVLIEGEPARIEWVRGAFGD
jgi:putative endonuclease